MTTLTIAGLLCLLAALLVLATDSPVAAAASLDDLRARAREVRREVARLDHRAEVLTEKYNAARAALDQVTIRLEQSRSDLKRVQARLDVAQAQRDERLVSMYKSDAYGMLDVLLSLDNLSDVNTQMDYFRSIDEADRDTVTRIATMEKEVTALTRQIERDKADALEQEIVLRDRQAGIEDELSARKALLGDLDARVKKLLAQQKKLAAAASARLAKAAGVKLGTIKGTPTQIAVVKETMKYLGIPYVWGGATPSGGFDCSGLVLYVYAKFGVEFPHGATMQARMGRAVAAAKAQPGDLVFFGTPAFYHHVGIYIGNGLFIEAPHTGDVVKVSQLAGRGCSLICRYSLEMP